jgi:hypothetical protein
LLIWTEKPSKRAVHEMRTGSKALFCGWKDKFSYDLQAIADSNGRFLSVWLIHPASSLDFISFICSKLYLKLTTPGFLAEDFVILVTMPMPQQIMSQQRITWWHCIEMFKWDQNMIIITAIHSFG